MSVSELPNLIYLFQIEQSRDWILECKVSYMVLLGILINIAKPLGVVQRSVSSEISQNFGKWIAW